MKPSMPLKDIMDETTLRLILRDSLLAGRKQLKIMVALILSLGAGGGGWAYSTHDQLATSTAAEVVREQTLIRHEAELRATSDRVESIAILLVQQGRHFEEMVRSVAPQGAVLPNRPPELDKIEGEILRRDGRGGAR